MGDSLVPQIPTNAPCALRISKAVSWRVGSGLSDEPSSFITPSCVGGTADSSIRDGWAAPAPACEGAAVPRPGSKLTAGTAARSASSSAVLIDTTRGTPCSGPEGSETREGSETPRLRVADYEYESAGTSRRRSEIQDASVS